VICAARMEMEMVNISSFTEATQDFSCDSCVPVSVLKAKMQPDTWHPCVRCMQA
jgi:uncharacterized metal-binding protein YceD (DUF177 family)